MLSGFHHVALTVSDLSTSADWYRRVLGLEELFREDGDKRQVVIFGFPGGGHAVGLVSHRRGAAAFNPAVTGLDHLAFTLPTRRELEVWVERLNQKGIAHSASSTSRPVPS